MVARSQKKYLHAPLHRESTRRTRQTRKKNEDEDEDRKLTATNARSQ